MFWERIYYLDNDGEERPGRWLGPAWNVGDVLTWKILDKQTEHIIERSVIRSSEKKARENKLVTFDPDLEDHHTPRGGPRNVVEHQGLDMNSPISPVVNDDVNSSPDISPDVLSTQSPDNEPPEAHTQDTQTMQQTDFAVAPSEDFATPPRQNVISLGIARRKAKRKTRRERQAKAKEHASSQDHVTQDTLDGGTIPHDVPDPSINPLFSINNPDPDSQSTNADSQAGMEEQGDVPDMLPHRKKPEDPKPENHEPPPVIRLSKRNRKPRHRLNLIAKAFSAVALTSTAMLVQNHLEPDVSPDVVPIGFKPDPSVQPTFPNFPFGSMTRKEDDILRYVQTMDMLNGSEEQDQTWTIARVDQHKVAKHNGKRQLLVKSHWLIGGSNWVPMSSVRSNQPYLLIDY
jgi:hypothetical protein